MLHVGRSKSYSSHPVPINIISLTKSIFIDDFLPTTIWMSAEPAIAVVSTCLPSLRPLFVRLFPFSAPKPLPQTTSNGYFGSYSSQHLASTWRSRSGSKAYDNKSFSRLSDGGKNPWDKDVANNVAVYGGKGVHGEEVLELGDTAEEEVETPKNRIRAKTTVVLTYSERVDWQDELF